jgi:hypothetical protein
MTLLHLAISQTGFATLRSRQCYCLFFFLNMYFYFLVLNFIWGAFDNLLFGLSMMFSI